MISASRKAKAGGLTGVAEMSRLLATHRNTLNRWSKERPKVFDALVVGCKTLKDKAAK